MGDPTSRALSLLGLLQSRPSWRGAELAERLGVTPRTLRRDIDRLRELGYTVEAEPGPGGGYRLGRGEVIPPLLLDEGQAITVTLALIRAAQEGLGDRSETALQALGLIDKVIPSRVRERIRALREAAVVNPTNPGSAAQVAPETLIACADAIQREVRLTFAYTDRNGAATKRSVEPHKLVAASRNWKLIAYDLDRDDWRTFRLDRLTEPRIGTWRFTSRPGVEVALASLGEPVPPEVWRHQVVVHIHAPVDAVRASMSHMAGTLHPLDPSTTLFRSGADTPEDAARWLAQLDHDFTVLGDEAVVDAVTKLASRLQRAASTP